MTDGSDWKAKTTKNLVVPESYGVLNWSHGFAELVRQLPFDPEQLEAHVFNKIKFSDVARKRNQTIIGKLWNKIMGVDCEKIVLDGITVRQLFEIIGDDPPEPTNDRARYKIDHENVRRWYSMAFPDGIGAKGKKYF